MFIVEYRIPLPLTTEEYQIGHAFTAAEMYKSETGGGEGVEVLSNEPFVEYTNDSIKKGQYTYRIYYLSQKVPPFIRRLAPQGKLEIHEESWNYFPHSKTEKKLNFIDDDYLVTIQTTLVNGRGIQDNVHGLSYDILKKRHIVYIDIVNGPKLDNYPFDLSKFKSVKTQRGPFTGNWTETTDPIMTCYKLVMAEFKWFGMQTRIEKFIQTTEKKLYYSFHKMLIYTMDKWYGMSQEEIRQMEKQSAIELHKQRYEGTVRGILMGE